MREIERGGAAAECRSASTDRLDSRWEKKTVPKTSDPLHRNHRGRDKGCGSDRDEGRRKEREKEEERGRAM